MNNPHIISTTSTAFGLNFSKEHNYNFGQQNYGEIDERLFDTYLEISGRKNNDLFDEPTKSLSTSSSADVSSADESDSSSYHKSTMGRSHKSNNSTRKTKSLKKSEDFIHSDDNDSLDEFNTTKANKSITRKSSTTSSVVSTETAGEEKKQKSLYKTELCRNWEETGHCRYGIKCQYAHGASDLREIDRHPKYKTQKCRTFHHTGACPYGARCNFRHFNLPGDALEMKNLEKEEKEEEEKKRQQSQQKEVAAAVPSLFSAAIDHQKVPLQQNWFLESPLAGPGHQIPTKMNTNYDSEDSLLPSNAESLLPHQLLFDLESPDKEEEPARCPLRNYVNLPSFSQFQVPSYHPPQYQQPQQMNQQQCKTFFRPWLF